MRRLAQRLRDDGAFGCAVFVWMATLLGSWREGRRLTASEAESWVPATEERIGALRDVGLLDDEGRIPAHAWDRYYGPAHDRLMRLRTLNPSGLPKGTRVGTPVGRREGPRKGTPMGTLEGADRDPDATPIHPSIRPSIRPSVHPGAGGHQPPRVADDGSGNDDGARERVNARQMAYLRGQITETELAELRAADAVPL